ncbi:hypothetical protein FO519_005673 [Halicephalobus sp. NKZ332]|nr:hypothetical protein FO519_005673 [Halicephalobus sp. NKZ332]
MSESGLDYHGERRSKFGLPCPHCFPQATLNEEGDSEVDHGVEDKYINLFDFPKFGGFTNLSKLQSYNTRDLSFPWFADVVYTLKTPIPHRYNSVYNFVLESRRVQDAVQKVAAERNQSVKSIRKEAIKCLAKMRASLSRFICRICGYVLFKVFRRVMKKLLINPSQLMKLKKAEDTGIPIVYLPLHRSHLDYLLITWTVWHFGLRLPHIASGDNLNLSGFGWLLRATGAFFIHRSLNPQDSSNKNEIYRAVLNSYMVEVIKAGMPMEFFLEGTRSRFGKTLLPKNGLISNIIEAVEEGIIPDVYLVPVSYSYDNIVEGIFHEELMGIRKEKESVWGIFRGILKGFGKKEKCGTVTINFGSPCRLKDYLSSLRTALTDDSSTFTVNLDYSANPHSYRELLPWHDNVTSMRTLIRAVGYHVVFEAHQQKPITVSSVISMLLLCQRKQTTLNVFIEDMNSLCKDICNQGYEIVGWNSEADQQKIFEEAISHFRHSVTISRENDNGSEEVWIQIPQEHYFVIDLCYRKNEAIAPFALLSVISMVFDANMGYTEDGEVDMEDTVFKCLTLCNILQVEVIFCRPCEDLKDKITNILKNVLRSMDNGYLEVNGHVLSFDLSFYGNILRPFLQTLFIVVKYFVEHQKPNPKDRREIDFIRRFLLEKSKNRDPTIFSESYNSDSVYNSIKLLRMKKIVAEDRLELIDLGHAEHVVRLLEKYIREPKF